MREINYSSLVLGILLILVCVRSKAQVDSSVAKMLGVNCASLESEDSTIFIEIHWIKKELVSDNLMEWAKQHHLKIWEQDLEYIKTDSALRKIYLQDKRRFIERVVDFGGECGEGEKVFYYSTPKAAWRMLSGEEGLVIIKDCVLQHNLVLMSS